MKLRRFAILAGFALALVAGSGSALAGGWAITSVDSAPQAFVAGETYEIEYSVLQHGQHPVTLPDTSLTFTSSGGEVLVFPGVVDAKAERHVAQVTLPSSGDWTWTANQGAFGDQELGALTVAEASSSATLWTSTAARLALTGAALVVAVLLVLQAVLLRRQRVPERSLQPARGIAFGD